MKRYVSLEDISDGKLYKAKDLVRADCLGCRGCSKCCRGMGESIVMDPYDIWRLTGGLDRPFPVLMEERSVGLSVVDGVILPHLMMNGDDETCAFLDEDGRCSIHSCRPGICRLFPLGRYYEEDQFWYFLQTEECDCRKAKIRVEEWLDTPELFRYEEYLWEWHELLKEARALVEENPEGDFGKNLNLFLLRTFFMAAYEKEDFYGQFRERVERYRGVVS